MADLVLPAASSFERDVVLNGRGGMFFLSEKAIEPVGEAKNDIEIMIGMLRAMQLHDEALNMAMRNIWNIFWSHPVSHWRNCGRIRKG